MQLTAPVTVMRSKIEQPVLSGVWVRRPHLEARLDHALVRSLTVVTAPAGHGKTSSIITWLRVRGVDAAWVTVDDRDADLTRFATHVAAVLDRFAPGMMPSLFAMLTAPDRLAASDLGDAFGEILYDLERDVVLVLDDFHAAGNGAVAAFLAGLLHSAPRRLHTILSSRARPPFPLSRFRTMGDVEELSGADLRFSAHETGELLHLETGEAIDPELARSVQASVGGWPAAIRLVTLSRGANEAIQPRETAGARHAHLLHDYLRDEVLTQLPPPQRELLLWASLVEQFNESLLKALSENQCGRLSRTDFERLRALELFREVPGLSETWFAYHPVFRDVFHRELEHTVDAATIADLHRSVAHWFAEAGLTREAVHHLVVVDDIPAAAMLIESRLSEAFAREDWQSVASWLRSIPMEAIRESPDLLLASAWVAYLSGRDARIAEFLEALRDPRIRQLTTEAQHAEVALLADWPKDDPDAAIKTAEDAVAFIPASKRYRYGYAHLALGMALTSAGREEEALTRLATFTERESARMDAASIRGYFGRVVVLWQMGRLTHCEQTAADQFQLAQTNALPVSAGWGAAFLGFVAHERGDLARATRHFDAVFASAEQLHFMCIRDTFFAQILTYQAQGLQDEADRAIARFRELAIAAGSLQHLEVADSFSARIALVRGDLVTAQRWLDVSSPPLRNNDLKSIEHPILTRCKVLIAVGTPDMLEEADRLLSAYVSEARATFMRLALLEGLAVTALLHEARGDRGDAARVLRESLEMAALEGIVQRYAYLGPALTPILRRLLGDSSPVQHARAVLDALEVVLATQPERSTTRQHVERPLLESPLSARELEVVRCLVLRLTNSEIGEKLFISPITVRHHVTHITEKLGVSGRRAAATRATELGLLD